MAGRKTRKKLDRSHKAIPDVKDWADVFSNYGKSTCELDDVNGWETCNEIAEIMGKSNVRAREILRRAVLDGSVIREKKTVLLNDCVRTIFHYKVKS
jgi:predicted DNA-binding ArsR family transcriptional regulator